MEHLTGYDAAFLYLETPTHFHHGCALLRLDPSTMEAGDIFGAIRSWLAERIKAIPPYTEKVHDPWYNLGRPVWITDTSFDLDNHLFRRTLPSPGSDKELARLCGEIASRRLNRASPLWEAWVFDGLADGDIAVFWKWHNSSLDGVRGNSHLGQVCGNEASEVAIMRDAGPPEALKIARSGLATWLMRPIKLARLVTKLLVSRRRSPASARPEGVPAPLSAPRTSINTTLTPNRNLAWASLSLPTVLSVKEQLGLTLNDVVLALTATVVRNYLLDRDELPQKALQAFVPVSVHGEPGQHGRNQTTGLLASLHTTIEDPVERALAIAATTKAGKRDASAKGASRIHDGFELAAPYWGTLFRWYSRLRLADRHAVMQNLVVSNIGGRLNDLSFGGARLVRFYPFGAPIDGGALFVAVATLDDRLNVGLISCPEIIADLAGMGDGYVAALAELADALEQRGGLPLCDKGNESGDVADQVGVDDSDGETIKPAM